MSLKNADVSDRFCDVTGRNVGCGLRHIQYYSSSFLHFLFYIAIISGVTKVLTQGSKLR